MGEPILSGPDIPTKLLATKNKVVVQAELEVEGLTWHVTCVSMGNPHCVTFGAKDLKVTLNSCKKCFLFKVRNLIVD